MTGGAYPVETAGSPRRRFGLSLTRIVGVMALCGVALIVGVTAVVAWSEQARLSDETASRAEGVASFLADHANRLFEVCDVALASTRAAIGMQDWDDLERSREVFALMHAIADSLPYIEDVWLNDSTGRLRLTSYGFPTPPSNAADRLAFKAAAKPGDELHVGELIIGKVTKRATFLVSRRLEYPDRSFRGMVSATADLAYFSDYWRGLRLPYDGRIRLVRAATLEVLAAFPLSGAGAPPADAATAGLLLGPSSPAVVNVTSDASIGSFHRVGDLPLYLNVEFPRAGVTQQWRERFGAVVPFAAAALVALLAMTALAFRQARREARTQAETAQARADLAQANTQLESTVALRTAHLREANEELQQFAYLISHDLRAPLVNVLGFSRELEGLARELFDAAAPQPERLDAIRTDIDEALSFIRAGTTKMDRLLNHILKLSREGKRTLHPEAIDMTALLQGLADAVRFQADEARATIEVTVLPPLVGDRLAVEQIFGNLLDNAVKYLDPARPGRIRVTGEQRVGLVSYAVEDNGRGIAPKDRERVFELFRRAGAADRPGEGIGLAHVRMLSRALGGRVDLVSEPGTGTVFTVTLPAP